MYYYPVLFLNLGNQGCACDGSVENTKSGLIIGECNHADANGHFCFVSKRECAASGDIAAVYHLLLNKWVNYDLCNCNDSVDCDENILKFGDK